MKHNYKTKKSKKAQEDHLEKEKAAMPIKARKAAKQAKEQRKAQNQKTQNSP
jgi:hypothetical protein